MLNNHNPYDDVHQAYHGKLIEQARHEACCEKAFLAAIADANKKELSRVEENVMWHAFTDNQAKRVCNRLLRWLSSFWRNVKARWQEIFVCAEVGYLACVAFYATTPVRGAALGLAFLFAVGIMATKKD